MSFSSDLKEELSKINNLANKEQVKYELIGYLLSSNTSIIKNKKVRYSTESDYNINRYAKLLSNMNVNYEISVEGNMFVVIALASSLNFIKVSGEDMAIDESVEMQNIKEEEKRALIRGSFLGSGSISNPENSYHLEIAFQNEQFLNLALKTCEELDIKVKKMVNDNKYCIYLKEGEEISKILILMGANRAVLRFEEIRVQREMRGKVNRIVNCESANLNKTINASIEQIAAIKKLQDNKQFNKLDDKLKEIATLRLENPDIPLSELGKMLKEPLGKSGVNYRLKKIIEIANNIK